MEQYEKIKVFIKYENGKTVCMCLQSNKRCNSQKCEKEDVLRDKYYGWEKTFYQDRFGKSTLD